MKNVTHKTLSCGIELACVELPERHIVALEFRILAGAADEPPEYLGLARQIQETIELGTEKHDGRGLSDAFDEIGAGRSSAVGRETSRYTCVVLPEFLDRTLELHAEFLRTPTFPEDSAKVSIDLARQELTALGDDPQSLSDKLLSAQVYGPYLGRHPLGERESLDRMSRQTFLDHWRNTYCAAKMHVAAAGAFDAQRLIDGLEKHFAGFGGSEPRRRPPFDVNFKPEHVHHQKDLEQQQIGVAFPGVPVNHASHPVQRVMIGVLAGGMSGRLFTEVREKQGLAYWVSAWAESPRGSGMIFLGASTTPERCDRTYATLLAEVDRLGNDLNADEVRRSATGIIAKLETSGETTRSRCADLADDLFHFGHPVPYEEEIEQIKAVTVDDIHRYLDEHPRDKLSVLTLGPRPLSGAKIVKEEPEPSAKS